MACAGLKTKVSGIPGAAMNTSGGTCAEQRRVAQIAGVLFPPPSFLLSSGPCDAGSGDEEPSEDKRLRQDISQLVAVMFKQDMLTDRQRLFLLAQVGALLWFGLLATHREQPMPIFIFLLFFSCCRWCGLSWVSLTRKSGVEPGK